jgi:hypothetical protein
MVHNLFNSLQDFTIGAKKGRYYSLAALEKAGLGKVSRLPVSSARLSEARPGDLTSSSITSCPHYSKRRMRRAPSLFL